MQTTTLVAQRTLLSPACRRKDLLSALKKTGYFLSALLLYVFSLPRASLLSTILPPERLWLANNPSASQRLFTQSLRLVLAARVGAAVHQLRVGAPGGMPLRRIPHCRLRRRLGETHDHTTITIITLNSDYYHL